MDPAGNRPGNAPGKLGARSDARSDARFGAQGSEKTPGNQKNSGEKGRQFIAAALVTLIAYVCMAHTLLGAANPEAGFLSPSLIDPHQLVGLLTLALVLGADVTTNAGIAIAVGLILSFLGVVFLVTWRLAGTAMEAPRQREALRQQAGKGKPGGMGRRK